MFGYQYRRKNRTAYRYKDFVLYNSTVAYNAQFRWSMIVNFVSLRCVSFRSLVHFVAFRNISFRFVRCVSISLRSLVQPLGSMGRKGFDNVRQNKQNKNLSTTIMPDRILLSIRSTLNKWGKKVSRHSCQDFCNFSFHSCCSYQLDFSIFSFRFAF
jgi:hypothetical protein